MAAALGYTRRYRRFFFVQQCLFRHVRRCLLLVSTAPLDVRLGGAMPRFRPLWRALTQPAQECFTHPLSQERVWDVGLRLSLLQRLGTKAALTTSLQSTLTFLGDEVAGLAAVGGLVCEIYSALQRALRRRRG